MVLRPMNCPHHIQIYRHEQRSYRELPLRLAEFGTMWRYEKSGELSGLSRVRRMDLNDAHIFCTPEQIQDEIVGVVELIEHIYGVLGIKDHWYRLSLWDPNDKEKYVDNPEMWERGEQYLKDAMDAPRAGVRGGAGRGRVLRPEDRHSAARPLGPQRDDLDHPGGLSPAEPVPAGVRGRGRQVPPAGDGPPWRDRDAGAHDRVPDREVRRRVPALAGAGPGAGHPDRGSSHRVRRAGEVDELRRSAFGRRWTAVVSGCRTRSARAKAQKVPYILVMGDRDVQGGTVSVRERGAGDLGAMERAAFLQRVREERDQRVNEVVRALTLAPSPSGSGLG